MRSRRKRHERGTLILIGLAMISGVLAAALGYAYIEKRLSEQRASLMAGQVRVVETPELITVVVVQRDRLRGETLQTGDLSVMRVPSEGMSVVGVISDPQHAVGRVALQNLYAGEWVLDRKLTDTQPGEDGWNRLLIPGMRAIRLPVDQVSGLLGLLQPDDRVDLIAVIPTSDGQSILGRTLEQNVTVLAVGQRRLPQADDGKLAESGEKNTTVTLEVTQAQAERIALALEVGKLRMALRNPADTEHLPASSARLRELERPLDHIPSAPRPRHTVQVITGGTVSTKEVQQ